MLNKIYLIALAAFIFGMGFLTYMASDWLTSVSNPQTVRTEFEWWLRYGRIYLLFTSLLLLVLANVILWKTRKTWAFWTTLAYFAIFILLQTFWLDRSFVQYKVAKGLDDSTLSISPIIGVLGVIAAGAIVFFNQFLVKRMIEKMSNKEMPVQELPDEADVGNTEKNLKIKEKDFQTK
jgi:hypothetical protein